MATVPTAEELTEVQFISGVTAAGTVAPVSFQTWSHDTPATYGASSYAAKWGSDVAGMPAVITYAFAAGSNWSATEQAAFSQTLHLWSAEAGVTFQQVASGSVGTDLTLTRAFDGEAEGGITQLRPGAENGAHLGSAITGSVSIDPTGEGFGPLGASFADYGGYPYTVLLHEEGHALGLGHAGAYDDGVSSTAPPLTSYDSRAWSLMSYIDSDSAGVEAAASTPAGGFQWGRSLGDDGYLYGDEPTTPMPLDILALQRLYGLPASTPLSGGQTFGFHCNIAGDRGPFFDFAVNTRPVVTLWDKGTGNTLDLSGFSSASHVDLNAGAFSSCAGLVNNVAIAYGTAIDVAVTGSGNDVIQANPAGDIILAGPGDDVLRGGGVLPGAMEMLFGNQGDDTLSSSSSGSVELFGGRDEDVLSLTSSGRGVLHYLFGNLGADTLTASGGFNMLYGGQGGDILSTATDTVGHNTLYGDLGDDVLTTSVAGADTVYGGAGADSITLTSHSRSSGDVVAVAAGDSTALSGQGLSNLDQVAGFLAGADHLVFAGHSASTSSNVALYVDPVHAVDEAGAFQAAALYAYGAGAGGHLSTAYLVVQESYGGAIISYVFTPDHAAIALSGATTLGAGDILAG